MNPVSATTIAIGAVLAFDVALSSLWRWMDDRKVMQHDTDLPYQELP